MTVSFSVTQVTGAAGSFKFAQTSGGTNYWNPSAPYISSQVDNAPPDSDIISLIGCSSTTTYKLTLSEAIKDPIMDIVSLGQPGFNVTYDFDRPFDIPSQGVGFWGGGPTALQELPGDVLQGAEGHGTIQFIGTFDSFSWTAPTSEDWHGFHSVWHTDHRETGSQRSGAGLPCPAGDRLCRTGRRSSPPDTLKRTMPSRGSLALSASMSTIPTPPTIARSLHFHLRSVLIESSLS